MESRVSTSDGVKHDVDTHEALNQEALFIAIPTSLPQQPIVGDDVNFEDKCYIFMRELRRKLFARNDDEDAYEHVRTVLENVDLFHFPGVTHDAIMLRKVHIFYTGLDIPTRKILDSYGFIPLMTPTQALELIQVMADHSHDWYDITTTRERINDVLDKVDAIHKNVKGEHLAKEYHLKTEDEAIKHINELCGYVLWKPSRDFTRPLGPPSGLKGLLHTLKATVIPTKLYKMVKFPMMVEVLEEADLEHGLEHAVSSLYQEKSRGVFCSNSTLVLKFSFP
ncbi:hypothetical protein Tco_0731282 [Tanacetum coccineum]